MWGRPDILWGLLALSIPIALHLLQLRRFKRVAFSNVAFLKDVQKETRSRHRLRNLLILLARLLAFALVIMAFADPMLAPEKAAANGGQQAVSIYVDSSPSMMASSESLLVSTTGGRLRKSSSRRKSLPGLESGYTPQRLRTNSTSQKFEVLVRTVSVSL